MSRPVEAKPNTCREQCGITPTGISGKVSAQYPGRSDRLLECYRRGEVLGSMVRSQPRASPWIWIVVHVDEIGIASLSEKWSNRVSERDRDVSAVKSKGTAPRPVKCLL